MMEVCNCGTVRAPNSSTAIIRRSLARREPRGASCSKVRSWQQSGRHLPAVQANYGNAPQELTNHYPGRDRSFPRVVRKMAVVFSNCKVVIEFDGLVEVTTMRNLSYGLRR